MRLNLSSFTLFLHLSLLGLVLLTAGCGGGERADQLVIRMATTTSTANSGLLDHLLPEFQKDTGIRVEYLAMGTGRAIKHGRNGEVDVILVHAPPAEEKFVQDGFGVKRIPVMWNDFIILGPPDDPASISGSRDAAAALARISESRKPFISRGDDSGTHKKEKRLWELAGINPAGEWYVEAGQGMGACLAMANDKLAYVLTDRGTYLSMLEKLDLAVVFEGDSALMNPYAIIAVNPKRYPDVKYKEVQRLIEWFTSQRAKSLITDFRVNGEQLFHLFDE